MVTRRYLLCALAVVLALSLLGSVGTALCVYDQVVVQGVTNFDSLTLGEDLVVGGRTTLSGNLDLDGNSLLLDADGNTTLESSVDDVVTLTMGNGGEWVWEGNATSPNVVGGSGSNSVVAGKFGSVIAGGGWSSAFPNTILGSMCTISGGYQNAAGPAQSVTIGGGQNNRAIGTEATIAGGRNNTAQGGQAAIGGGMNNTITSAVSAQFSTIGGGFLNTIGDDGATISGGHNNTINAADFATIAGGEYNTVADGADYAAIPGGHYNAVTGTYAFAAGRRAKAAHRGSFVWADSTDADYTSTATNTFNVRAAGGIFLDGDVETQAGFTVYPEHATDVSAVFACLNEIHFTDTTSRTMCILPANVDITDIEFVVTTLFDDTGTDVVDCGIGPAVDPDDYVDNLDVTATSVHRMGDAGDMPLAKYGDVGAGNVTVVCVYTGQNGNATSGSATLVIEYVVR